MNMENAARITEKMKRLKGPAKGLLSLYMKAAVGTLRQIATEELEPDLAELWSCGIASNAIDAVEMSSIAVIYLDHFEQLGVAREQLPSAMLNDLTVATENLSDSMMRFIANGQTMTVAQRHAEVETMRHTATIIQGAAYSFSAALNAVVHLWEEATPGKQNDA